MSTDAAEGGNFMSEVVGKLGEFEKEAAGKIGEAVGAVKKEAADGGKIDAVKEKVEGAFEEVKGKFEGQKGAA